MTKLCKNCNNEQKKSIFKDIYACFDMFNDKNREKWQKMKKFKKCEKI